MSSNIAKLRLLKSFNIERCFKKNGCNCVNNLIKSFLIIPLDENQEKQINKSINKKKDLYEKCFFNNKFN